MDYFTHGQSDIDLHNAFSAAAEASFSAIGGGFGVAIIAGFAVAAWTAFAFLRCA